MAVTYRILPRQALVYVRFVGHAIVADSAAALDRFARDPHYRPDLRQLVDLSGVTGFDPDYVELFRFHARKAAVLPPAGPNTVNVHIAPGEIALRLSHLLLKSYDGIPGFVHRVVRSEDEALHILGIGRTSIPNLIQDDV